MKRADSRIHSMLAIVVVMVIAGPVAGTDVRHVHNDAQPRDGIQTVELKELWRAGNEEDGVFFGQVPRVDTDRQGNIHILDAQLCQVHIYSPRGDRLRVVFREATGRARLVVPGTWF